MTKIHWMILATLPLAAVFAMPWFGPGPTEDSITRWLVGHSVGALFLGLSAWMLILQAKHRLGLGTRHLRVACYKGYAGRTLRALVVMLGVFGISSVAVGVMTSLGGLMAWATWGWTLALPMLSFSALLVAIGFWPYAVACVSFPYDFPGRTM